LVPRNSFPFSLAAFSNALQGIFQPERIEGLFHDHGLPPGAEESFGHRLTGIAFQFNRLAIFNCHQKTASPRASMTGGFLYGSFP
jgi:hypothetical protein